MDKLFLIKKFFKVIFWFMMCLAISNVVLMAKFDMLMFLEKRRPTDFINFGYYMAIMLIILVWIVLWTWQKDRIDCTLDSLEIYERHIVDTNAAKSGSRQQPVPKMIKMMLLFEIVSWIGAVSKSIFFDEMSGMSPKEIVLANSEIAAEMLFQWEVPKNETTYWKEQYGLELNLITGILSLFGILMEFAYRLTMITIRDTTLVIINTYGSNIWRLISRINDFASLPLQSVTDEDCQDMEEHWETYLKANDLLTDINWTFGLLIKFLHVGNELFLVYFINNCLDEDRSTVLLLWMLFTIVKFLIGYIQAAVFHQFVSILFH